jgi:hypothetical protein
MIKLKDLIKGGIYDPFTGDLQEGLIRTVSIEQAMEVIEREVQDYPELDFLNDGNTIILGFKPTYPSDQSSKYSSATLSDPRISKVLTLANNLGYFPSIIKYELDNKLEQYTQKYQPSTFRDLILNGKPTYLVFDFEAKYDPEIEVPQYVYHITTAKFVNKIKQIGLTPKTLEKRSAHPERIYVSLSKKDSDFLFRGLKQHFGKNQGVELTIDTSLLKDPFYEDPNFKGKGVYTYQNISPQAIVQYTPIEEN